jgi:tRNA A-37 threonylcarbamoyl transferase component Bud32
MVQDEIARLTRETLSELSVSRFQSGWRSKPDVLLVQVGERSLVVKDFAPRGWLVRNTIGRWATAREVRAYRALDGLRCVPRFLGCIDSLAFAVEHRPGHRMSRRLASSLPPGFVAELEQAVASMHERGVVHLDLRHRTNVLADPQGHPVLIDFASAICLRRDGWLGRTLLPLLAAIDRAAVAKWRERLEPQSHAGESGQVSSFSGAASGASASSSERRRGASRPK